LKTSHVLQTCPHSLISSLQVYKIIRYDKHFKQKNMKNFKNQRGISFPLVLGCCFGPEAYPCNYMVMVVGNLILLCHTGFIYCHSCSPYNNKIQVMNQ